MKIYGLPVKRSAYLAEKLLSNSTILTLKLLVAIVGPTAVGKTDFSLHLAKHYHTEIISADSRQVYKEMTIGTAKPDYKTLSAVPHHFINHVSVDTAYNAGKFAEEAMIQLQKIFETKNIALLCGGSGLYLRALYDGIDELPTIHESVRIFLQKIYQEKGIETLQKILLEKDPDYYHQVDLKNPHRIIRALEICISSHQAYSNFLKKTKKILPFELLKIGLQCDRTLLYHKINNRADKMMQDGFLDEAKNLHSFKHLKALQTVGYQEMFAFLENKISLQEAIDKMKQHTRNFAKRQITWFKKENEIEWLLPNELPKAIELINQRLRF